MSKAKRSVARTACANNLRQIGLSVRMYADDGEDKGPTESGGGLAGWTAYRKLLTNYVSGGTSSRSLFVCPADIYHYDVTPASPNAYVYIPRGVHRSSWANFTSYAFNAGNTRSNRITGASYPGIAERKLSTIREPSRTIMVAEFPAFFCFSWHQPDDPKKPHYFNNAMNNATYVDGHVSYTRFYWDASKPSNESWEYDPPSGYGYKWSAD